MWSKEKFSEFAFVCVWKNFACFSLSLLVLSQWPSFEALTHVYDVMWMNRYNAGKFLNMTKGGNSDVDCRSGANITLSLFLFSFVFHLMNVNFKTFNLCSDFIVKRRNSTQKQNCPHKMTRKAALVFTHSVQKWNFFMCFPSHTSTNLAVRILFGLFPYRPKKVYSF